MNLHDLCARIREQGVVAILRADSSERLVSTALALAEGGVDIVEITMTTPNALAAIEAARKAASGGMVVGVGSVLDGETARAALLAGAEFVVSPVVKAKVMQVCRRYQVPSMAGAFTPTEALTAHEAGADFVKIFPANLLGPGFLKDILAPMPRLSPVPTGGIDASNAGAYLEAGAAAVGVGSALAKKDWIAEGRFGLLTNAARELASAVEAARRER